MKKMIIIDGNSLLFRAYFATAYGGTDTIMRTSYGLPTNAIFAFAGMINKIIQELKDDDHILVGFDTYGKTFRHEALESYKAQRKETAPELIEQLPIAREFLDALNIKHYEQSGVEGDDVCGTMARIASEEGFKVEIYTSDRDFLQLINSNISVNLIKKGMSNILIMTSKNMYEETGMNPYQVCDYKGLRGDSSDNLFGIPGIGDKTALKLLDEYQTLENIFANVDDFKGKLKDNLIQFKEQGMLCKELSIIHTNVELPFTLDDTRYNGYFFDKISDFCSKYELTSFLNRLSKKNKISKKHKTDIVTYNIVDDIDIVEDDTLIGVYVDISGSNYISGDFLGIAITVKEHNYYINSTNLLNSKNLIKALKNESIGKTTFDSKMLLVVLGRLGINVTGIQYDLLLISYLLDSSLNNNVDEVLNYFNVDLALQEIQMDLLSANNPEKTAKVAYYCNKLKNDAALKLIENNVYDLYIDIELPLAHVLADMELEGFPLDGNVLQTMGETFKHKLSVICTEIYNVAGEEFNISSPKQVGKILYEKIGLPDKRKGSTSFAVLSDLNGLHPIVGLILEHRKYAKLISTYIDSLCGHILNDGKLHPLFNQAITTTGRLSTSEPNLQNISIRDEEASSIRKAFFYSDEDIEILSLDYSQIELRILASLSNCEKLINMFNNDEDIHNETAKKIFNIANPSSSERRKAKAVNFGIIYGISDWGLSEQIEVSIQESRDIINNFYTAYPEVKRYLENLVDNVITTGSVTTMFGRKRHLREINDSNYQVREFAKRAAMNAPIQGTAADLIKIAMIKVDKALKKGKFRSRLVLQIHDELLFKVYKEEKNEIFTLVKSIMEDMSFLKVKLQVDGGFGKTWFDCK